MKKGILLGICYLLTLLTVSKYIKDFHITRILDVNSQKIVYESTENGNPSASNLPLWANHSYSEGLTSGQVPPHLLYDKINFSAKFKNPCFYSNTYLQCLPYAFLLGMPKSGTTDLYVNLAKHPDVIHTVKEPHWWTRNRFKEIDAQQISASLSSYTSFYQKAANLLSYSGNPANATYHNKITVDASASTSWDMDYWSKYANYTASPGLEPPYITADVIKSILPDSRFMMIFRNPVDRLYSDYLFFNHHLSVEDFHNISRVSIQQMKTCIEKHGARSCAYNCHLTGYKAKLRIQIGLYHIFVEDWLKVFPRDRFLFLRLEDYHSNRTACMDKICQHLGLGPFPDGVLDSIGTAPEANKQKKSTIKHGPMLPETRRLLEEFYQPFNDRLAQVLNEDGYRWT